MGKLDNIKYTLEHKKAYLKVEKLLYGKITFGGLIHDLDKIFLYLAFSDKTARRIHRFVSSHHREFLGSNGKLTDFNKMLIDCECARLTKPDKQMNAEETIQMYYKEMLDDIYNRTLFSNHCLRVWNERDGMKELENYYKEEM